MNKAKIMRLRPVDLTVDPNVQRRLDRHRIKIMAAEFDPVALGFLTISHRDDRSYVIIDGQHRSEAAKLAGQGTIAVDCRVIAGLTVADEAHLFRLLNTTVKPGSLDSFLIGLVEGHADTVAINGVVVRHGWTIARWSGKANITAVSALERVWALEKKAPGVLDQTIQVLTAAWGYERDAVQAHLVRGLGELLAANQSVVDTEALAAALAKMGTPASVLGKAAAYQGVIGGSVFGAIKEVIVLQYNTRKRSSKKLT